MISLKNLMGYTRVISYKGIVKQFRTKERLPRILTFRIAFI